jgi:endonuclease YncB( thermonuclease family)
MSQADTIAGKIALVVLLGLAWGNATADALLGRVVAISDGDTVTVLNAHQKQYKIRLAGIDAPEHGKTKRVRLR